ncbi:hypothetical protein GAMM_60220 [Gammaproteobacteria bacterium]
MLSQDKLGTDNLLTSSTASKLVQRVNLVRFVPKQQEIRLPFKQILQICALILIIFSGLSIHSFKELLALNGRIAKLQLQKSKLAKELNSDRIRNMQEFIKNNEVSTALYTQRSKNGLGFSNYLEAIATACPNGVWLTSININKHNNNTTLSGKAHFPDNVVQLVSNLNNESLFNKTPFSLTKIEKTEEKTTTDDKTAPKIIYAFIVQTKETSESKT